MVNARHLFQLSAPDQSDFSTGVSPHVDMKGLGDVDFEASRPGAVRGVHESDTQQLVIVVARPVEDNAGARQGGDVALWVSRTLTQMSSYVTSVTVDTVFTAPTKPRLTLYLRPLCLCRRRHSALTELWYSTGTMVLIMAIILRTQIRCRQQHSRR